MLSKPNAGWTEFRLSKEEYSLSYLNDIPFEWVNQAIYGLETLSPFVVHGVCEPGRILCLVSYWNCHIISEDEGRRELIPAQTGWEFAHVSMLDFCKLLYADISENLDEWSAWVSIRADTERVYRRAKEKRKRKLKKRLRYLESLIRKREENFDDDHYLL